MFGKGFPSYIAHSKNDYSVKSFSALLNECGFFVKKNSYYAPGIINRLLGNLRGGTLLIILAEVIPQHTGKGINNEADSAKS